MSAKSRLELACIEFGNPATAEWHGSLDATWDLIVGCNAAKSETIHNAFVYLWRVELGDRVFHKVGWTENLERRFKSFCWSMIPVATCVIEKSQRVSNRKRAELCERRFIVAARSFCIGGEWFCF